MRIFPEHVFREKVDKATISMLDLWQSLCQQKLGVPIEVGICDRKEHIQLKQFPGELNTALPAIIDGKVMLLLYLDSLSNVNPIIITHEIGHWILKLQGFEGFINISQKHNNSEIFLNSMAHHVPLYMLQKSFGHNPQDEIDKRTENNIKLFEKGNEQHEKEVRINNALMLADDMINCSTELKSKLKIILKRNHYKTFLLIKKILKLVNKYDLQLKDQNQKFSEKVIQDLKLEGEWANAHNTKTLITMVNKI